MQAQTIPFQPLRDQVLRFRGGGEERNTFRGTRQIFSVPQCLEFREWNRMPKARIK